MNETKKDDNKYELLEFSSKSQTSFDGIMNYLSQIAGKNIHDNGSVEITSNYIEGNRYPKCLVEFNSESVYYSDDLFTRLEIMQLLGDLTLSSKIISS